MIRIILGVIAGFIAWLIVWFVGESIIASILPEAFGAPQRAFQTAIESGGEFTAPISMLLIHVVLGAVVSLIAGFLAALVAGENKRAPLVLGLLLLGLGLLKASMSWQLVPLWYHVLFSVLLPAMTIAGGRLKTKS